MPPSGHIVLPTFKIQIMFSQSGPKISCYWRGSLFQVICDITFACLLYRIMKSVSTALFQSITRMYCTMSAISYQGKTHYWTRWDPTPLFKTAVWYTFFCTSFILQPEAWQKHELLVCWISVNFLWWNLNLRIRSLGTFTRQPTNHKPNRINRAICLSREEWKLKDPVSTMQKTGWTNHFSILILFVLEKGFTLDVITRRQSTNILLCMAIFSIVSHWQANKQTRWS